MSDFFDKNFDMEKYPAYFNTEEGKNQRQMLANFFEKFHSYYQKAVEKSGYSITNFMLLKPFNMVYGIYKDKLYFSVSNDNALKGRTGIYKINDGTYLDVNKLSIYGILCGFGDKTLSGDIFLELLTDLENPNTQKEIEREAYDMVQFEIDNNLERNNVVMKINPLFGAIDFKINSKKVFMLMPFGDQDLNEFYEDNIKTTIANIDMHCSRADDIFSNKSIIEDIWRNINEARIIIADLTQRNPNVFYEIGIAHTLGKDVILISQNENDIPFDLSHIRTILYKNSPRGALEFQDKLKETIKGIMERGSIQ